MSLKCKFKKLFFYLCQEEFKDAKGVIRIRISKTMGKRKSTKLH